MSKKIIGSSKGIEKLRVHGRTLPIKGTKGIHTTVDVETVSKINRATQLSTIKRYLREGWDWAKFSPIKVARILSYPEGGQLRTLDGDHRRHMWKIVFPDES